MNHPSNENIPSRSFSYHAFNFTFLLLLAVFFISLYTVALLKSNSRITLSAAVERNISCSDAVHRAISSRLTRADFEQINTKSDMNSAQYRSLQSYLNELRSLNSTRYLYTAKRGPGGKPIYLIDGLDLEAPDFAYPGTYLEEEMLHIWKLPSPAKRSTHKRSLIPHGGIFLPPAIRSLPPTEPMTFSVPSVSRLIWKTLTDRLRRSTVPPLESPLPRA